MEKKELFRKIPKIDKLLESEEVRRLCAKYGYSLTSDAVRNATEEIRGQILEGRERQAEESLSRISDRISEILQEQDARRMQPVINASGVILHTNLGRAPLGKAVMEGITRMMTGYTNLEYDLGTGTRGQRYDHFSDIIKNLTGAEAAIAVNNNAGAVLLMLSALTSGGEVIVSRGELIEIGGKFRVPEVMEQSGSRLVEVGTTNRTYPEDYEGAVTGETRAFLKVYTSNYRITGFTRETTVEELSAAAHKAGVPLLVDLGSGCMVNLKKYGLPGEDTVAEVLKKGADLVCFSGDKLLGGPQAGIIAGKQELIDKISRHPLTRALRIDKFTAAALEATLRIYLDEKTALKEFPVLEMLMRPVEQMEQMAHTLKEKLEACAKNLDACVETIDNSAEIQAENRGKGRTKIQIVTTKAKIGGGALPEEELPSVCVSVQSDKFSAAELSRRLRLARTPIITRIEENSVLLDMRTVFIEEISVISDVFSELLLN
ncbi:L-seryl-tRNA(Sec) selenium transferase [Blautia schinkii]|nr:L-seryl-tRNA(Sec) selenium transferase [Blautia schinkii]